MQIVESGSTLDNMAWCRSHTFVVNGDDKKGLHWFVCAFHFRVQLELFIIWVWEPLSSIHLICPFLVALEKHGLTTKRRALGLQKDRWSCVFSEPAPHKFGGSPGFLFRMFPSPHWVQVLSTIC